ncbi:hypothetical protein CLV28_2724 [Sediminihabitans luteus]|uniref:Ribbon-helix-helix CopG family protein n=1 Tax=Sediminihabitans luteus TaxID=1138585 RepID=A0A2M9CD89_9CELL|nr:hypothetical protein [Sediminihabitans luteus]PJJ69261.1 hypothetical protein CLV28_2724 [Sediminihabitans luteus]GII98937.1 hypothetical protein Slu03_13150 [Sediminihabitans luteus]
MAMDLRLSPEAQAALERIVETENVSANQAVENAVLEYDRKRVENRDRLIAQIVAEDEALLNRLA